MLLPRLLRGTALETLPKSLSQSSRLQTRTFVSSLQRRNAVADQEDYLSKLPNIDPSQLSVTKTITPKQLVPNKDLIFGRTFTGQCKYHKHLLRD